MSKLKISYYTEEGNLDTARGYGTAGFNVVRSLQALGHEVPFDDPTAPVQISFCSPTRAKFHDGQYKIIYTPWESTELPDGWLDAFNAADEVWATSEWVAQVYSNAGVRRPIRVFHHGINDVWKNPTRRQKGDVLNFFHHGEPALRKGGQMALDAFLWLYRDRDDVHLTIKAHFNHYLRYWEGGEFKGVSNKSFENVTVITDELFLSELTSLYDEMDIMLYPSYGEGFGFIPLQALAVGMPVISTTDWAPYKKYIPYNTTIETRVDRSIWGIHPGDVFYPQYDSLIESMKYAEKHFDSLAYQTYYQTDALYEEFDWLTLTGRAFAHIVAKFAKN